MPIATFKDIGATLLKNSRNAESIYHLLKIAKTTKELDFQRNTDYVKFKSKKNINLNEIEFILSGFYNLEYPEESIYWNKRALEEKVCDKERCYGYFNNLIHLFNDTKVRIRQESCPF